MLPFFLALSEWSPSVHDSDPCRWSETHTVPRPPHPQLGSHVPLVRTPWLRSMWELGHKEGWAPKNWCFQTVALEKTVESPLDSKEIQPINPKGNQLWIFIGGTDAEAEAPILWPPDGKSWLIGKDPDAWKYWRQEEKGTTGDEMAWWHHWLSGYELGQTSGDSGGQGSLSCCSPRGHK